MKKKYKCRLSASSLLVNVKGKVIRLEFEPDVVNEFGLRGCSYATDNVDIQKEVEHNKRFNSACKDTIWTDDIEVVENPVETKEVIVEEPVVAEVVDEKEEPVEEPKKIVRRQRVKKEA